MRISLVVAMSENNVIGRGQQLPWHLPDDLKHFRQITLGKPVLMGRRTFDSIGRALPGRLNLVLSRGELALPAGVERVGSLRAAIARAGEAPELCVIGGGELYRLALPEADTIYLTRVFAMVDGDTYFPALDPRQWRETERIDHPADDRHAYAMCMLRLERYGDAESGTLRA
ncbi:MAG TPA: dihydrofolate reductase [Steroidobacteraceae bacterium]|nr:dihydrofolate reductase [Steroidobacteraceae bacterium]